jgi:hypothetical protein
MSSFGRITAFAFMAFVLAAPNASVGQEPDSDRHAIETIASAIRARRESVSTLRMKASVEEVRFDGDGAKQYRRELDLLRSGESVKSRLAGDVRVVGGAAGGAVRSAEKQLSYHDDTFTFYTPDVGPQPSALIDYDGVVVDDITLRMMRMAVEGELDRSFWQQTEHLTVLGSHDFFGREIVIVGNTDYITEAVLAGRGSRSRVEYFLDPARDYLVVGYAVSNFEGVKTEDVLFELRRGRADRLLADAHHADEIQRQDGRPRIAFVDRD